MSPTKAFFTCVRPYHTLPPPGMRHHHPLTPQRDEALSTHRPDSEIGFFGRRTQHAATPPPLLLILLLLLPPMKNHLLTSASHAFPVSLSSLKKKKKKSWKWFQVGGEKSQQRVELEEKHLSHYRPGDSASHRFVSRV